MATENEFHEEDDLKSFEEVFGTEGIIEHLRRNQEKYAPLAAYENATTYYEKLKILRDFYLKNEAEIIAFNKQHPTNFFIAYPINWSQLFSPIEKDAWESIRIKGNIVLYPQYPVGNFHVDFGNPALKIALEVDGKDYHDKKRDMARDEILKSLGWTVIRVTGAEMVNMHFKDITDCYNADLTAGESLTHILRWIRQTGDGVIEAIKRIYFQPPPSINYDEVEEESEIIDDWTFYNMCKESLDIHKLI